MGVMVDMMGVATPATVMVVALGFRGAGVSGVADIAVVTGVGTEVGVIGLVGPRINEWVCELTEVSHWLINSACGVVVDQMGAFALGVAIVVAVHGLVLPVKLNLAVSIVVAKT